MYFSEIIFCVFCNILNISIIQMRKNTIDLINIKLFYIVGDVIYFTLNNGRLSLIVEIS